MMAPLRFRLSLSTLALVVALLAPLIGSAAGPADSPSDQARERVIVILEPDAGAPGAIASELSQRHRANVSHIYQHAVRGFAAELPAAAVAALANDPRVAYVEVDQMVHASDVPTGVDRVEVDKKLGVVDDGSTNVAVDVDVAIIDTGIDASHPDLNVVGGTVCSSGSPFDRSCNDGSFVDDNGHGTHVAGTAGAMDNGSGVVGVAPGARLYGVKVLRRDGSGYISWIVAGIDWVTAHADTIEVANMSLGCECQSQAMDDALTNSTAAGLVYVVAAGNSGKDASTFSPASHPNVIAVSAMADFDGKAGAAAAPTCRSDVGTDDAFATFSNFGSVVDLAAPGVCIESTIPGGGYAQSSGTSMASPHGAGAAALYIAQNEVAKSANRWSEVRSGLQSSAWSVPNNDPTCGFSGAKSAERFLMLAACDSATGGGGTLSVSVTTDRANYQQGDTIQITVTVTDGSSPVSGAAVDVTITTATDRVYTSNGTTDGSGNAVFTFKAKKPDGSGTYNVDATASKSDYTSGSGSTTFTVN